MTLNKAQTALHKVGSDLDFWKILAEYAPDCYENVGEQYDEVQDLIELNEITEGVDADDSNVVLSDYPYRKRPEHRPSFNENE